MSNVSWLIGGRMRGGRLGGGLRQRRFGPGCLGCGGVLLLILLVFILMRVIN